MTKKAQWRGNNDLLQTFTVNNLNELTHGLHGSSATMTVEGTTGALATNVTVGRVNAVLYRDATFAKVGLSVTNGYDSLLRRPNLITLSGGGILARTLYQYDAASRLAIVSDTTNTAGYS